MPLRPPAGFIRPGFDPLKNPDAPTGAAASGGDASASVSFTPPTNVGGSPVSEYYAVSNPDQITGSAASSPVSVTGLTNGTPYTFTVWALNTYGPGPYSAASGSVTPSFQRALFAGLQSETGTVTNAIQYVSIVSTGNALDFGDLIGGTSTNPAGNASSTRGLVGIGALKNTIVYVTLASTGNANDFGDMTILRDTFGACATETRLTFGAGRGVGDETYMNIIDFVTIATTGNAADFGDLTQKRHCRAAFQSTTRGVYAGGQIPSPIFVTNVIDFITIASTGNATDFGDVTFPSDSTLMVGCSSNTRGVMGSNNNGQNVIGYVTIASTGNTSDFGDLTVARRQASAASGKTRALFAGGNISGGSPQNVIDFFTIASLGNATDFGDMIGSPFTSGGCGFSSAHGGL